MITRLPCRFTNLFTYWLYCDGYRPQLKKDALVMRRGDSVLKIFYHKAKAQQDYLMNEACQRKFRQFCRCYLMKQLVFQHYRGWNSTCINCGRQWCDGEWLPLDFYRGVRKENINAAKRLWRKLKDIGSEITFEEFEVA